MVKFSSMLEPGRRGRDTCLVCASLITGAPYSAQSQLRVAPKSEKLITACKF